MHTLLHRRPNSVHILGCGLLLSLPLLMLGCGGDEQPPSAATVTYLCRETGVLVEAPLQAVPAVNPATNKPTLYRALYCETCRRWQAVPPPDQYPGNPLNYHCPVHRKPMAATGPK